MCILRKLLKCAETPIKVDVLKSRKKCYSGYVSVFENTPKELILKSTFPQKIPARKGAVRA